MDNSQKIIHSSDFSRRFDIDHYVLLRYKVNTPWDTHSNDIIKSWGTSMQNVVLNAMFPVNMPHRSEPGWY